MADTIIEQIFQAAVTQGQTMTTGNGYNTNVAADNVARSKINLQSGDIPAISLLPGEEEAEPVYQRGFITRLLVIEAVDLVGSSNASVVQERLLGDIIRCFTRPDQPTWWALADNIRYMGGGPRSHPEAKEKATGAAVVIAIQYKTAKGNPYAQ